MVRAIDKISDAAILAAFDGLAGPRSLPTYVVRNTLRHRDITTRQVRARLKRMERAGLVERVGSWVSGTDYEWQPARRRAQEGEDGE